MKPDRPLIVSILLLTGGLILIFGYAHGTAGLAAALPISNSTLHIDVNATGAQAMGGIALLAIGILFMAWAMLAALVSQIMNLGGSDQEPERLLSRKTYDFEPDYASDSPASPPARRGSFLGLESDDPAPQPTRLDQPGYRSS